MTIAEEKQQLREFIANRIAEMTIEEKVSQSETICSELLERIPLDSTVCAYSALENEVDLTQCISGLLRRGDRVFLPRYAEEAVTFHHIQNLNELTMSPLSILEPPADFDQANPRTIDVVLVPGRAFDSKGKRLGRGKGGYDRWIEEQISANHKAKIWGVAFPCQMVEEVPTEEHDQRMDEVIFAN